MLNKPDLLRQFGRSSLQLAELLKAGRALNLEEQTFIENHLLIVQLAFTEFKYRRRIKASTHTDAA